MLLFHDTYGKQCLRIYAVYQRGAPPIIAKDCPGQAKSVGRGACHVLHHLMLHLLQDQVQGFSWIKPKVAPLLFQI